MWIIGLLLVIVGGAAPQRAVVERVDADTGLPVRLVVFRPVRIFAASR